MVIPGEDEQEVTVRVTQLEAELATEGDAVAAILVRQLAIASIRTERAYRHESALAAERMRRAADVYEEGRQDGGSGDLRRHRRPTRPPRGGG